MRLFRVRTVFSGPAGSPYLSTLYFEAGGNTETGANAAVGTFWNSIDSQMHNSVSWSTEAEVTEIDEVTGNPVAVFPVTPVTGVGALSGELLPRVSQGLIRFRTGVFVGGREVRGRCFVPGLDTGTNDGGVLLPATITALNNAAAALISDSNSVFAIWSRKNGVEHPAVTGSTWNQFASLRSRRD